MAKFTSDQVLEAALAKVATCTRQAITSTQPASYAGIPAVLLGSRSMTAGVGGASYSAYADGDVSGRKITVSAATNVPITANGNAQHICLDDGSVLHQVTTVPSQAVTNGNTANISAYDVEFNDVTP